MNSEIRTEYKNAVYFTLEKFQFIEETIRMYLDVAIQIAKIKLKPYFPINLTKKNLSKLSLGRLIDKFSNFNKNTQLIKNLKTIISDRNNVAHQSLLFTLEELGDDEHLSKLTQEMKTIENRANDLHGKLLDERYKLQKSLGYLRRKNTKSNKKGGMLT